MCRGSASDWSISSSGSLQDVRRVLPESSILYYSMLVAAEDLFKLLLALVLGGVIGWERELYDKLADARLQKLRFRGDLLKP
jgi:hypothetical protein